MHFKPQTMKIRSTPGYQISLLICHIWKFREHFRQESYHVEYQNVVIWAIKRTDTNFISVFWTFCNAHHYAIEETSGRLQNKSPIYKSVKELKGDNQQSFYFENGKFASGRLLAECCLRELNIFDIIIIMILLRPDAFFSFESVFPVFCLTVFFLRPFYLTSFWLRQFKLTPFCLMTFILKPEAVLSDRGYSEAKSSDWGFPETWYLTQRLEDVLKCIP